MKFLPIAVAIVLAIVNVSLAAVTPSETTPATTAVPATTADPVTTSDPAPVPASAPVSDTASWPSFEDTDKAATEVPQDRPTGIFARAGAFINRSISNVRSGFRFLVDAIQGNAMATPVPIEQEKAAATTPAQ